MIGRIANLTVILPANRLDEIAITLGLSEYYQLEEIVGMCEKSGVHTKFIPDYNKIIPTRPYTEDILGAPGHQHPVCSAEQYFQRNGKEADGYRGFHCGDHSFFAGNDPYVYPDQATSPGPLIYRQERVGLHNRTFWMYKIPVHGASAGGGGEEGVDSKERSQGDRDRQIYAKDKH